MSLKDDSEYWLDCVDPDSKGNHGGMMSFLYNDIIFKRPQESDVIPLLKTHFGMTSRKAMDERLIQLTIEKHEEIRQKVNHEANFLITSLFCSFANLAGMHNEGGGKFEFKNIADDMKHNWNVDSFVKTFFVLRAVWDDNPRWLMDVEVSMMKRLGFEYKFGFHSTGKKMGFVASIISRVKTRKLRECNNNIGRNTGWKILISKKDNDEKDRRNPCKFKMEMLQKDEKSFATGKSLKNIMGAKIISDNLEENGSISLYKLEGKVFPENIFLKASRLLKNAGQYDSSDDCEDVLLRDLNKRKAVAPSPLNEQVHIAHFEEINFASQNHQKKHPEQVRKVGKWVRKKVKLVQQKRKKKQ